MTSSRPTIRLSSSFGSMTRQRTASRAALIPLPDGPGLGATLASQRLRPFLWGAVRSVGYARYWPAEWLSRWRGTRLLKFEDARKPLLFHEPVVAPKKLVVFTAEI